MSESKQPFWDIVTTLTEYHEFLLERSAEYGELVKNNAPFGSVMLNAARELARLHASNADLLEALERARVLVGLLTIKQVLSAGYEAIEAAGLNPWCVNEGLAMGDESIGAHFIDHAIAKATGAA